MLHAPLRVLAGKAAVAVSGLPGDSDFRAAQDRAFRAMVDATKRLANREISAITWADLMEKAILDGHIDASVLGRGLAIGTGVEAASVDLLSAQIAVDGERFYIGGFLDALLGQDPRYWDGDAFDVAAISARQEAYLGKMRGTAHSAFLHTSPVTATFAWKLGAGVKDHCSECPEYAGFGYLPASDWPTHPGDNDTPCLFNCECYMVRNDGIACFKA